MPTYKAPIRDTEFILHEVLQVGEYAALPGFFEAEPDLVSAILSEGAKFVEEVTQPLNQIGDELGCIRNDDGSVTTPTGFKAAYDQMTEAGWGGLAADPQYGGQGLPHVISTAFEEYMISANMAFTMYLGLTQGAIAAITAVGSNEQKQTYIPNMVAGRWGGTMNLTESHCGTDLGLLRTRAEVQADGSYKITGTKIFISSGEHDLTDNIIHLVLAKMPDSPDSIRGISLFIVPKFLINDDGTLGKRNSVSCGSLEEKMGIHGNSTCVMNYDEATGYIIGEQDKGMRAMFIMMNAARLGVGMQGLSQSEVSYQNALSYAKDRLQGRSLTGAKNKNDQADPIIVHPDVRRMLLNIKAFNEGARGLILWAALLVDLAEEAETEQERTRADDIVGLLTPVIKAYFTDKGYENATAAQQCLGGHGYIREWGLEQFVRDARIAMIYEGTNGIQALDLVGRKLVRHGGRALRSFMELLRSFIAEHGTTANMTEFVEPLERAVNDLGAATSWLMKNALGNADNAGAASVPYLYVMSLVSLGYMWARIANAALLALSNGTDEAEFYSTKLQTARYFFSHQLPETSIHRTRVEAGSANLMEMDASAF
jgi:alkylation response protein AidB-like acyl-CoA dehydrogenase